jgi:PAS domain S-box-containing protein
LKHQPEDADLLRLLVERVVDYAIFVLSPVGTVLTWNQGAERLKGYSREEIIGQSFERFYTEDARAVGRPARLLRKAASEGRVEDEGWRVRKDGTRFWADVVITALRDDRGSLVGFAKVTRDLTERRQAEEDRAGRLAAERAAAQFERLQVASAALAAASRPESAAEVLVDVAVQALGAASGLVALPTLDRSALQVVAMHGAPFGAELGQCMPLDQAHPLSSVWHLRRAVFVHSRARSDVEHSEIVAASGLETSGAWAAVPLLSDRNVLGVIGLSFDHERVFDTDERSFLLALADVGAQAMLRARLYAAEEVARQKAETAERAARDEAQLVEHLRRVSLALSAELDLDKVLQTVADAATSAIGATVGYFAYHVVDERGEQSTLYVPSDASQQTFDTGAMQHTDALFDPTLRDVDRCDDILQDPRYRPRTTDGLSLRSCLMVPVISRSGAILGRLFFGHYQPGAFTERSERLADGIAAQAAVAIDNARIYQQVQQAVQTRDEFLAAAAHDLKTPLAATKGIAQLLRKRIEGKQMADSTRIVSGLERIDQSVDRMTGFIDELLDLGRLQLGQPLDLERRPVDVAVLLREVVADHQPNAPRHTFHVSPIDGKIVGYWDPVRLRRVFDNLVSNAVKYSPDGGEVLLRAERWATAEGCTAVIQVTDHGVGIPPADLPFVFERFRRGGNVAFIQGTGIGLAVAYSILQHHGGSITVESFEGKGSTFTVRLPLD